MISPYVTAILNHLWQSTLFAIAVWLITRLMQNHRAALRHRLWVAASAKFLIPFSLLTEVEARVAWHTNAVALPLSVSRVVEAVQGPFAGSDPLLPSITAVQSPHSDWIASALAGVWAIGFMASLIWWFIQWRRVRRTLRSAKALQLDLPIRVLSCPETLEPGVFGVFRPVLLLPVGIAERLSPLQMKGIIVHELCHVRRRDNMTAAVHMFVEALFWFHPLVWWIKARMLDEQERACDEEVLGAGVDPQAYAESILRICEFYMAPPLICISRVTGPDLKRRIADIMNNRARRRLSLGRTILITVLAMAVLAILAGPSLFTLVHPRSVSSRHWSPRMRPVLAGPVYTATVGSDTAQFVFPLDGQAKWNWYRDTTKANGMEYGWNVGVKNGGHEFGFGYFLFKVPGELPMHGDINQLLDVGQWSIFEYDPKTGNNKLVQNAEGRMWIAAEGDKLFISMDSKDLLRDLFSDRPDRAIFGIRQPSPDGSIKTITKEVPIYYPER